MLPSSLSEVWVLVGLSLLNMHSFFFKNECKFLLEKWFFARFSLFKDYKIVSQALSPSTALTPQSKSLTLIERTDISNDLTLPNTGARLDAARNRALVIVGTFIAIGMTDDGLPTVGT